MTDEEIMDKYQLAEYIIKNEGELHDTHFRIIQNYPRMVSMTRWIR